MIARLKVNSSLGKAMVRTFGALVLFVVSLLQGARAAKADSSPSCLMSLASPGNCLDVTIDCSNGPSPPLANYGLAIAYVCALLRRDRDNRDRALLAHALCTEECGRYESETILETRRRKTTEQAIRRTRLKIKALRLSCSRLENS